MPSSFTTYRKFEREKKLIKKKFRGLVNTSKSKRKSKKKPTYNNNLISWYSVNYKKFRKLKVRVENIWESEIWSFMRQN